MTIDVRMVGEDELDRWSEAVAIGFHTPEQRAVGAFRARGDGPDRVWGAFDGSAVVGTLRGAGLGLTVPGAVVPCDVVTAVTVLPTHRRRGLLTRMMAGELGAARERGEPVAGLFAAEWPIYGRFGYGPAADLAKTHVDTRAARFLDAPTGSVELVTPQVARVEAAALYDRVRVLTPGAVTRPGRMWDELTGLASSADKPAPAGTLHALGRDDAGEITGYVRYRFTAETWLHERPDMKIEADDLFGLDVHAEARLWRYLCDHDWATRISSELRPIDEAWRFLLHDARAVWQDDRWDAEWIRVLDVPGALTARRYEVPGRLVLRVTDKDGYADGTYLLDGSPDGADCAPTTAAPDITLPVGTLGALYLGAFGAHRAAALRWLTEETPGAVLRLDAMFRTAATPWPITMY